MSDIHRAVLEEVEHCIIASLFPRVSISGSYDHTTNRITATVRYHREEPET